MNAKLRLVVAHTQKRIVAAEKIHFRLNVCLRVSVGYCWGHCYVAKRSFVKLNVASAQASTEMSLLRVNDKAQRFKDVINIKAVYFILLL